MARKELFPGEEKAESLADDFSSLSLSENTEENIKGNLFQVQPKWNNNNIENICEKLEKKIDESKAYPAPTGPWNSGGKIDLEVAFANLPAFVRGMAGDSLHQEATKLLSPMRRSPEKTCRKVLKTVLPKSPQLNEIDEQIQETPTKDKGKTKPEGKFDASSYPESHEQAQGEAQQPRYYFNCEYMLEMHVPNECLSWFTCKNETELAWITGLADGQKDKRWVFTPSFRRAKIALLKWSTEGDEELDPEKTHRLLVVRPSEFERYKSSYAHLFPIIRLPNDEIGVGYPRYWIQKIALSLGLDFIWMVDDSVVRFYEYHPQKVLPTDVSDPAVHWRSRKFGVVFSYIEKLAKDNDITVISPRRFMGFSPLENEVVCKPPRIAVFLNLLKLKEMSISYRPDLKTYEDMIFGYECSKEGLKVCMSNRIHLDDKRWTDTGARSASVTTPLKKTVNPK